MDKKVINDISERLASRLAVLQANLAGSMAASHELGVEQGGGMDSGDESLLEVARTGELTQLDRNSYELSLVKQALHNIETDKFGWCVDCGEEIDVARLVANPIAKRCLRCQSKHEDDQDERDATPSL